MRAATTTTGSYPDAGGASPCEKRTYAAEQFREVGRELGQVAASAEGEPRWNAYRIVEHLLDHADRIEGTR